VDMYISMDIHAKKSVDMDMDMDEKFHIHGKPGYTITVDNELFVRYLIDVKLSLQSTLYVLISSVVPAYIGAYTLFKQGTMHWTDSRLLPYSIVLFCFKFLSSIYWPIYSVCFFSVIIL